MHRNEWRAIARARLREAEVLLAAREWSGAYYLTGYAIECGLKACLVRQFQGSTMPDKKVVIDAYTHDLVKLVGFAGLKIQLEDDMKADASLAVNWATAKDWNETARYRTTGQSEAEDIYAAVTDRRHGVMKWVRKHW